MKLLVIGLLALGVAAAACAFKWDDVMVKPKLRAALEQSLKDQRSADYRNESLSWNKGVLCGEVNAKNGYGAYTGFKRFVAEPNRYAVEGDDLHSWRVGRASTAEIGADLELRTAVLREAIAEVEAGGQRMSQEAMAARVSSLAFQRIWDERCT